MLTQSDTSHIAKRQYYWLILLIQSVYIDWQCTNAGWQVNSRNQNQGWYISPIFVSWIGFVALEIRLVTVWMTGTVLRCPGLFRAFREYVSTRTITCEIEIIPGLVQFYRPWSLHVSLRHRCWQPRSGGKPNRRPMVFAARTSMKWPHREQIDRAAARGRTTSKKIRVSWWGAGGMHLTYLRFSQTASNGHYAWSQNPLCSDRSQELLHVWSQTERNDIGSSKYRGLIRERCNKWAVRIVTFPE